MLRRRIMTNKPPLLIKYVELSKSDGSTNVSVEFKFDMSAMKPKSSYTPCLLFHWMPYSIDPEGFPGWTNEGSYRYSFKHTVRNKTDTVTLYTPSCGTGSFPYKVTNGSTTRAGTAHELTSISGYNANNIQFKLFRSPYSASYVTNAWKSSVSFYFFIREHPEIFQIVEVPI